MDQRYQHIANFLTDTPWRKKEIVALTAEKSNKSERTVHNWLEDIEKEGFIKTIKISRNRVFIERNKARKLPLDIEIDRESKIRSLIKQTQQLIDRIIQNTFPSQSRDESMPIQFLLSNIRNVKKLYQDNTINPIELKKIEDNIGELREICREQFVVVHEDQYIDYIFDILDDLMFLLDSNVESTEDGTNDSDHDLISMTRMYLSVLIELSLNATLMEYKKEYDSRLSERMQRLQTLVKTSPVATEIYYLIQSHGTLSRRIEAFISKIQSQDRYSYNQFLNDARSFYNNEERQRLRSRLREIANELDGQQRTVVERLCTEIDDHHYSSYDGNDLRYYNRTKEKIIAILSHGPRKLEIIQKYSKESNPNVHSNINKLIDDAHIDNIEHQHGYYKLNNQTEELFKKERKQTPVADREKVERALTRLANWREEYVYADKIRTYNDKDRMLQMYQDPPDLTLLNLVSDCSFVLGDENDLELFFEILDNDLELIQKTDTARISTPSEIVRFLIIARWLHQQWRRGLENIRFHSELAERLDMLKKSHKFAHPDKRKHIRSLISVIDIQEANILFSQAVSDNDETIDDLKQSIDEIYYQNNKMYTVVDLLKYDQSSSTVHNGELREELLKYSVNVPYESLSTKLVK